MVLSAKRLYPSVCASSLCKYFFKSLSYTIPKQQDSGAKDRGKVKEANNKSNCFSSRQTRASSCCAIWCDDVCKWEKNAEQHDVRGNGNEIQRKKGREGIKIVSTNNTQRCQILFACCLGLGCEILSAWMENLFVMCVWFQQNHISYSESCWLVLS